MSRLVKTINVNGKDIIVNELTVKQIKALWAELTAPPVKDKKTQKEEFSFTNKEFVDKHWPMCVEGMTLAETEDLTPSELKEVYDGFAEVNAVFFDLALKVEGENPVIKWFRLTVQSTLLTRFAFLFREDMSASGITDTVSS